VIMIGEVRDHETAEIAIRVALTGHLVFSTLHTNDAASGIVRLVDIGLEPYLVATSVEAFIAQRLVRSICPSCKVEDTDQPKEIREQIAKDMDFSSTDDIKFYKGKGCKKCNSTGFFGRTAIYEILLVDEVIKELILRKVSSGEIKNVAVQRGMHTLRQDGWNKVMDGVTTPEEVMKLTETEDEEQEEPSSMIGEPVAEPEGSKKEAATGAMPVKKCRRVYARLNTKVNVSYKIVNVKGKSFKPKDLKEQYSTTEGISAGGLQFISNEATFLGSILELKIDLPDAGKPIICLAKVLRVELRDEEAQVKKGFYISVCFLDISSAERVRLNKYVEEELS
ncbi:MAG: Flp pilus assembly complex ATPase component TadA, partial [Candidatus Omnitrophica bacterium]|nr:Flp pilus assembly complex ATPase component TadA [Candidatus Omnitrophota bacterium]